MAKSCFNLVKLFFHTGHCNFSRFHSRRSSRFRIGRSDSSNLGSPKHAKPSCKHPRRLCRQPTFGLQLRSDLNPAWQPERSNLRSQRSKVGKVAAQLQTRSHQNGLLHSLVRRNETEFVHLRIWQSHSRLEYRTSGKLERQRKCY